MYLLFAWPMLGASGGFNDFVKAFDSFFEAQEYAKGSIKSTWDYQIVDASKSFEILFDHSNCEYQLIHSDESMECH